ncbi:MAG: asparagine synthase (glutamine-hydrolyzing) [Candidatus Hydrogenedentes bacterium]|nr:asparagine synthase (glutamine-hydrolyzing) [Candidatus Hydrogenedentota bacterium]
MCGICGIAHPVHNQRPDGPLLDRMTQSLAHRGPDDGGTVITTHVGLGHRRLSVVGVASGHQPMEFSERGLVLTYNGEIYNFPELRAQLESKGVSFHTHSDTEILLQGYAQWGMDELLRRLVGMFAFALWDGPHQRLYLVRDRLGVKPLYWARSQDGSLYFASELRALRLVPALKDTLNTTAALHYLTLGYVVGHKAIIEGIEQLDGGNYLTWEPGKSTKTTCYWDFAEIWTARQNEPVLNDSAYQEAFNALLGQCVSERLLSEVPLGAFLSGGLDSSLICAQVLQHQSRLKTFSMGFEERSYSELPWASLVAEELGTDHVDAIVACEDPDLLLKVAGHLDEPFADTSILPTYVLCREARSHLTVALSGDGGDELLAGYTTHAADKIHGWIHRAPAPLLALADTLAQQLPDSRRKVGTVYKLKQFLSGARRNPCDAHGWWRMLLSHEALRELVEPDAWQNGFEPLAPFRSAYAEVPDLNPLDRMLYVDYKTWLLNDILVKVDRASMAHGLEVRSPFLDHRLVEFCAGLPPHLKLRGLRGKHILRKAAQGQVPDRVIRRKKAGFNSPVSHWVAGPWRELVHDILLGVSGVPLLQRARVEHLITEHMSKRRDHGHLLFALLMFSLWGADPRT